jgi:carbamoyl-phosphate synthase small subunit
VRAHFFETGVLTGYQEILTDPSYCRQLITLTYPHIGNTGVNQEDEEATQIHASGLIIRDLPLRASNWRSQGSLQDYLERRGVYRYPETDPPVARRGRAVGGNYGGR